MLPALAIFTALSLAAVPAAAQRHDHDPTPAPHADESTRVRRVSLATGVALDVAERGRRDGKPVLFLHGYTDSRVSFARVLPALPAGIRAIVPSMRGHGDSERPECCYRPTDFAADAVALLDALGIPRATIVGHSLGSFIAQRIALEYPERVDRLVLVGSGYSPRVAAAVEFLQVVNALQDPVPAELIRDFQQSTLFAPVSAEFFSKILGESGKLPARVWRDVLNALLQHEGMGDLGRIRSPTLVVWGDQDQYWTRDQQEGLLRLIPGARLLVYEKIGHAPNWEAPGRFAADVVRFLEGPVPVARRDEGGTPDVVKVERIRHSRVRLRTGVELDVAQRGRSDGEPVLFLHGFTDSWYSFTPMLEQLPPAIRAIVPSQRGHGDSERPACCYLIRDFARDAVALLDALGIGQAVVVGHSNGSFAAQRIAIDHPERVKRLVLVGSAARPGSKPMRELNAFVQTLRDPVDPAFVREFQVSTIFKPVPPAYLDRVVEESYKLPARVWRDALAGLLSDTATGELDRIRSSTLVVWGAHDGLFARSDQDALVGAIRGAQFVGYPDLGHAVHWEDPARFIADLVKFLELPEQGAIPSGRPDTPMPPRGEPHAHGAAAPPGPMPLLAGLGDWSLRVTTGSAEAQRYFDQGLRLMYAFNHDEAVRSFERAVELDATCALCHWG
ncbi:MAG TPA: alpha/beta hydrolase, partial [Gemmatimonadaceae bacterium]|nr:alpha/beta hydrolase [Gemmatimonadaceae bacterium]